jgi:hypothetical protein
MMTNLTINQPEAEQVKRCISDLLAQLTIDEQQTKAEQRQLRIDQPPADDEFSLLEELELLIADLRGYASQIQLRGRIENAPVAIAHLQSRSVFTIPAIANFYFQANFHYPALKECLRRLDYLRLLLLEYLRSAP